MTKKIKILSPVLIHTKTGAKTKGDVVPVDDVLRPSILDGLYKANKIEDYDEAKDKKESEKAKEAEEKAKKESEKARKEAAEKSGKNSKNK
jgi:hypothetical protein